MCFKMNVLKAFMVISYWKSQIPPMMGNMKTYSPDVLFFFLILFNVVVYIRYNTNTPQFY